MVAAHRDSHHASFAVGTASGGGAEQSVGETMQPLVEFPRDGAVALQRQPQRVRDVLIARVALEPAAARRVGGGGAIQSVSGAALTGGAGSDSRIRTNSFIVNVL